MKIIELRRLINIILFVYIFGFTSYSQDVYVLELKSSSNDTILVSYFYNPCDSNYYELTHIQSFKLHSESNFSSVKMKDWISKNVVINPCFVNGWIAYMDTIHKKTFTYFQTLNKREKITEYRTSVSNRTYNLFSISSFPFNYRKEDMCNLKWQSKEW
jgi:hypothetical protein